MLALVARKDFVALKALVTLIAPKALGITIALPRRARRLVSLKKRMFPSSLVRKRHFDEGFFFRKCTFCSSFFPKSDFLHNFFNGLFAQFFRSMGIYNVHVFEGSKADFLLFFFENILFACLFSRKWGFSSSLFFKAVICTICFQIGLFAQFFVNGLFAQTFLKMDFLLIWLAEPKRTFCTIVFSKTGILHAIIRHKNTDNNPTDDHVLVQLARNVRTLLLLNNARKESEEID